MAKDILGGFGPERRTHDMDTGYTPPIKYPSARDVMNYATPQGPMGIMGHNKPGLGGENCGNAGTQGKTTCRGDSSGSPGLHGTNKGNSGSQR